jgi:hypothetical protein
MKGDSQKGFEPKPRFEMADHERSVEWARALGGIGALPERQLNRTPALWGAIALAAIVGGCASGGRGAAYGDHPNGYGVDFYEPFDNSRDYGPGYLVGPPNRAPLFPNDEGARSSGRTLNLWPSDSAPSIPSEQPNRNQPPSAPTPPSPVE